MALNAGAAFYVAGVADTIEEGFRRADEVRRSGVAFAKLEAWANRSQELVEGG